MNLWKNNLLFRLVTYFLLVSTASTAVIGLFAYYLSEETLTARIYDQLNSVSIIKEEELQKWVRQQEASLEYMGELYHIRNASRLLLALEAQNISPDDPRYQDAFRTTTEFLFDVQGNQAAFAEILILTETGGRVVASTNSDSVDTYRLHDTYFKQGKLGPYTQTPYVSPYNSRPTMTVSRPIHDVDGEVLGVLAIHLNLVEIDNIIRPPSSLADTGEVYLIDRHNAFFSSERLGSEEHPRGVHSDGINAAIGGQTGYGIYENYDLVPVIGTYRWLDDLDLALVAEITIEEAFAPARRLAIFILAIGTIVTGLLGIAVYFLARRITQPILAIADTAVAVASGNLAVSAPVTSSDEVGMLARTFNQMVAQLNALYAGLEQKVSQLQEKEQALQQYARRLEAQHEIDRAILKAQLPREIGLAALSHLHGLIQCDRSSIFLFDNDKATLLASINQSYVERFEGMTIATADISSYPSLLKGQSYLVSDLSKVDEEDLSPGQRYIHKAGIHTFTSLPLMARNILIGSLNLGHRRIDAFSKEDIAIAREVADQLAIAIQQAQLLTATQRQLEELSVLHAIGRASTEAASEDELLQRATEAIAGLLPADNFGILLLAEDGRYLIPHASYHNGSQRQLVASLPVESSLCGEVAGNGTPKRLDNVNISGAFQALDEQTCSLLCIPLKANGEMLGVFNAESQHPDTFSTADEKLLITLANQLAIAIEKLRLFEQTQNEIRERRRAEVALREARDQLEQRVTERTSELTLLNRAAQKLISSLEINDVLISMLEELRHLLNARASAVWLVDKATGELVCLHSSGKGNEAIRNTRLPAGVGIVGWVASSGQSDLTQDVTEDDRHYTFPDNKPINLSTRSLLSVPLRIKEQTIGVLQVLDTEPGRFTMSDVALVESLAATAAFAIENARLYKQAREDAETKSILLREVNHRVKNNLSAIIGILYAERRHADLKDQSVYQAIMQDLITRVQGLAAVHSLLSLAQWGPISLNKMVVQVINSALRALPPHKRIHLYVSPSPIMILPDQASNLALVINELTTNSIKYALEERDMGKITVHLFQSERMVKLIFQDDGPGFPRDVLLPDDPRHNVGFHLVQNLVRRSLKGSLSLQNRHNGQQGSQVIIEFEVSSVMKGSEDESSS